jgi:DNA-binding response OmpR family regulator
MRWRGNKRHLLSRDPREHDEKAVYSVFAAGEFLRRLRERAVCPAWSYNVCVEPMERILVVEDDEDLCGLICGLLEIEGYATEHVHDGREAAKRLSSQPPDAIILDVMLPGLTGFEICQRVKVSRKTNAIPVMMLTASDTNQSRESGLRVGADRYLTKPFAPDALLKILREILDHRRERAGRPVHTSVELQMQSDSRHREQLNDMLSELLTLTPMSEQQIWRIRYAVLEMIENAAEWGNRRQKNLTVTIQYEINADSVKFVITDQGGGFNPHDVAHAAKDDDPLSHLTIREKLGLRDGGFGILTARGLVDEFSYNATGNQVTLVKRFAPRAGNGV